MAAKVHCYPEWKINLLTRLYLILLVPRKPLVQNSHKLMLSLYSKFSSFPLSNNENIKLEILFKFHWKWLTERKGDFFFFPYHLVIWHFQELFGLSICLLKDLLKQNIYLKDILGSKDQFIHLWKISLKLS